MVELASFPDSYAEARKKFLDVATIGAPDAQKIFAVGCGTHGIEGYPGSAALPAAELTTLVIEFGTLPREGMQRGALLQR